jgi:hypothetical protein
VCSLTPLGSRTIQGRIMLQCSNCQNACGPRHCHTPCRHVRRLSRLAVIGSLTVRGDGGAYVSMFHQFTRPPPSRHPRPQSRKRITTTDVVGGRPRFDIDAYSRTHAHVIASVSTRQSTHSSLAHLAHARTAATVSQLSGRSI